MKTREIELTFLAKYLPEDVGDYKFVVIEDFYFPLKHPRLRLRRMGEKYELVRKMMHRKGDASEHTEEKIPLEKHQYKALRGLEGEELVKRRVYYKSEGGVVEVDIFLGKLKGLVLVDFEFKDSKELKEFKKPDFCLRDVTQERLIAGGNLAGKSYREIEGELKKLGYMKISI
jgi:adenylate cyclase